MAVVRKAQSISNIAKKKAIRKVATQSVRQPSIVTEMGDVNFGTLTEANDGQIVSYDAATDKFILITADELLAVSAEDNDIPDELVTALEGELDLGQIQVETLDGGTF